MDRVNWQSLETTEHLTVIPHPCFRSQPSFKPGGDPPACLSAKHSSKCTEISFGKKVINSLGSWANICKARQDPHSSKTDLKLRGFLGECKCIVCVSVLNGVFSWPPLSVDAGQWGSSPFEAWEHSYYTALLKAWPCCIVNRLVQLPFAQQCSKRERGTLEILEPLWDVGEVKST